ncbi:MAG: hypothetical protein EPN82_01360 [Bacteroidetes bacterium]|nr:MAG: hypothetical protein EPN82_01360 [Bacteroidota bacterium]
MRKIHLVIYFIILNCLIEICLSAQNNFREFEISPRVGNEISSDEKIYFNLFPKIKNFKSAKSFINDSEEKYFEIKYDSSNITKTIKYFINDDDSKNLKKSIEEYEKIYKGYELNDKTGIVWDSIIHKLIMPVFRYNSENKDTFIFRTIKGEKVKGTILVADSIYLVLAPEKYLYDWNTAKNICIFYHYSEIEELIEPIGIKLIGNKELFQKNLLFFIEKSSFLKMIGNEIIPLAPEIETLVINSQNIYKNYIDSTLPKMTNMRTNMQYDSHIKLGYSYPFNINEKTLFSLKYDKIYWVDRGIFGGYWAGKIDAISEINCNMIDNWNPLISFDYKIFQDFNIGLIYKTYKSVYHPEQKIIENKILEVNTDGNIYSIYTSYIQKHHDLLSYKFIDKFELNYLIGFLLIKSDNNLKINYNGYYKFENRDEPIKFKNTAIGALVSLNTYYYFTEYFTLNSELYAYLLTNEKLYYWEYEFSSTDKIFMNETDIYYADFGINISLGVHF